jgi:hypothetical protein
MFDEIYGLLCTALKKTPAEVGRMRMRDLERLRSHWRRSPPEHVAAAMMLRAYTTWKPTEKERPFRESTAEEIGKFAAAIGPAAQVVNR